jgi:hypothetical protein
MERRPLLSTASLGHRNLNQDVFLPAIKTSTDKNSFGSTLAKISHANFGAEVRMEIRVARWYIFKLKTLIWVSIGGSCNGRCWYLMTLRRPFFILYDPLVYIVVIWYICSRFGMLHQEKSGNPDGDDWSSLCTTLTV